MTVMFSPLVCVCVFVHKVVRAKLCPRNRKEKIKTKKAGRSFYSLSLKTITTSFKMPHWDFCFPLVSFTVLSPASPLSQGSRVTVGQLPQATGFGSPSNIQFSLITPVGSHFFCYQIGARCPSSPTFISQTQKEGRNNGSCRDFFFNHKMKQILFCRSRQLSGHSHSMTPSRTNLKRYLVLCCCCNNNSTGICPSTSLITK